MKGASLYIFVCSSVVVIALMIVGLLFVRPEQDMGAANLPPSKDRLFGTDPYGRDLLSVCMSATSRAGLESIWTSAITVVVGVFIGIVAASKPESIFDQLQAFIGAKLDTLGVFLVGACIAVIAPGLDSWKLAPLLSLFAWPMVAMVVRSEIIEIRKREFYEAALSLGLKSSQLFFRHVFPFLIERLVPMLLGLAGGFVAIYAALEFIGAGVSSGTSLGSLIFDSQNYLRNAPWYFISSATSFILMMVTFSALGRIGSRVLAVPE